MTNKIRFCNSPGQLHFCGECINENRVVTSEGNYYCRMAEQNGVPNGIVYYDTDATKCVQNGWYIIQTDVHEK